ncbi:MAG: hypothetical protein DI535_22905 [Citrobacter freundii]|nr:MAG: hypothetical protein DI535_22905 [Citrobacter freundii]
MFDHRTSSFNCQLTQNFPNLLSSHKVAPFFLSSSFNPFVMDRRSFFASVRKERDMAWNYEADVPVVSSGMNAMKGKLTTAQLTHLLKRTMFGASPKDLEHFKGKKLRKIVHELVFAEDDLPAPPVNNYNDPDSKKQDDNYFFDEEIAAGATWVNSIIYKGRINSHRKSSFRNWWFGLMLDQQPTLREKMVLFWHNHFATEANVVDNARYLYQHNQMLRKHALGNFKTLVKEVTIDPAMLRYLNGFVNTKKAPDENYGRELQELFTIGKGPDSHYTENDVKAAARILTGYKLDDKKFESSFDPSRHDEADKEFSSFYNNTVIKGKKGPEGAQETDELIAMLLEQQEVSKFICRKLYRFFVYHSIDATTEKNVIEPMAALFRKKDYEIKPVLEMLFSSKHFFDPANFNSMIKSPVDFTVGLCREYDIHFPDAGNYVDLYNLWDQLRGQSASMQQDIGDPPNVAGWQAYYQDPQYDKLWISSDTLPRRNIYTDRMVSNGIARNNIKVIIDTIAFTKTLSDPSNPDQLINDAVSRLYNMDLPAADKAFIKSSILLSGLTGMQSDHYWTDSWNNYLSNPGDKKNTDQLVKKLKALYKYLMNRPEYQLC